MSAKSRNNALIIKLVLGSFVIFLSSLFLSYFLFKKTLSLKPRAEIIPETSGLSNSIQVPGNNNNSYIEGKLFINNHENIPLNRLFIYVYVDRIMENGTLERTGSQIIDAGNIPTGNYSYKIDGLDPSNSYQVTSELRDVDTFKTFGTVGACTGLTDNPQNPTSCEVSQLPGSVNFYFDYRNQTTKDKGILRSSIILSDKLEIVKKILLRIEAPSSKPYLHYEYILTNPSKNKDIPFTFGGLDENIDYLISAWAYDEYDTQIRPFNPLYCPNIYADLYPACILNISSQEDMVKFGLDDFNYLNVVINAKNFGPSESLPLQYEVYEMNKNNSNMSKIGGSVGGKISFSNNRISQYVWLIKPDTVYKVKLINPSSVGTAITIGCPSTIEKQEYQSCDLYPSKSKVEFTIDYNNNPETKTPSNQIQ